VNRRRVALQGPVVLARLAVVGLLIAAAVALADGPFDLSWYTIDGGGITLSTGGPFTLGGTIGQPDAGTMSGGSFTLDGGFWGSGDGITAVGDDPTRPEGTVPLVYRLYRGAPNPFNPRTQVAFDLPRAGLVRLRVYDLRGALVRTLVETTLPAGHHVATWDGTDQGGATVASGAYLFAIDTGGFHARQKGLLLK